MYVLQDTGLSGILYAMNSYAVVKTGGKQYVVKTDDELVVDKLEAKEQDTIELTTLARFDEEGTSFELGTPELSKQVKAQVVGHLKGDKLKIMKFKAKVRYRRVTGFRPALTKLKIISIA